MTEKLRCLSIRQPWAYAIIAGIKDVENRSWTTDHRGLVVIHAGANKTVVNQLTKSASSRLPTTHFIYSALVGVVDLVDVVPLSPELEGNPWAWGPFCWRLANPRRFPEPIPAKGQLNLYTLPDGMAQRVKEALPRAEPVPRDDLVSNWQSQLRSGDSEATRLAGLYQTYLDLEDGENALRLAERGIALHANADAYVNRGVAKVFLTRPDYHGALMDYDRAIDLDPRSGRAYRLRSLVYRELGDAAHSTADLAKAKALGFTDDDAGDGPADGEI